MTTAVELLAHEITVFRDKVRIDVQTATPGIEFEAAWQNKEIMKYRKQNFYVVSREDLIASKRAAGREKGFGRHTTTRTQVIFSKIDIRFTHLFLLPPRKNLI